MIEVLTNIMLAAAAFTIAGLCIGWVRAAKRADAAERALGNALADKLADAQRFAGMASVLRQIAENTGKSGTARRFARMAREVL